MADRKVTQQDINEASDKLRDICMLHGICMGHKAMGTSNHACRAPYCWDEDGPCGPSTPKFVREIEAIFDEHDRGQNDEQ